MKVNGLVKTVTNKDNYYAIVATKNKITTSLLFEISARPSVRYMQNQENVNFSAVIQKGLKFLPKILLTNKQLVNNSFGQSIVQQEKI